MSRAQRPSLRQTLLNSLDSGNNPSLSRRRSLGSRRNDYAPTNRSFPAARTSYKAQNKDEEGNKTGLRIGTVPRPAGGQAKLDTFSGVFIPTTLNVLSILMFLRFGFILGQSGVIGMMGMLLLSYVINLVTTLSVSAISTDRTVRGGGAYYLISRSLGPEFGGSIGIVFYLGSVFNTGMNGKFFIRDSWELLISIQLLGLLVASNRTSAPKLETGHSGYQKASGWNTSGQLLYFLSVLHFTWLGAVFLQDAVMDFWLFS